MRGAWVSRVERVALAAAIALIAWWLPEVRLAFRTMITRDDAIPAAAAPLPRGPDGAAGLAPVPFTRVVLIDGVNRDDTAAMAAWNGLCARGLDLQLDVGFPTVSLPVQVTLWTGLTQQQTGVLFHSGFPLADPLGSRAIPRQVVGSIAIAESHPYIVQSLGFSYAAPPLGPPPDYGKTGPVGWDVAWQREAELAVSGPAPLAFVHVLRVDTAGHKKGRGSAVWKEAVAGADNILSRLVAAGDATHPEVRWFLLADHGHTAKGGHGGEERGIRIVRACIAGAGVAPGKGGPIALVDLSRAIADSTGARLPAGAIGRPLAGALAAPLGGDELLPPVPMGRVVLAILFLVAGAVITALALGRRAVLWGPWWWPVALLAVVIALGTPTLSGQYIYAPKGDAITGPARWGTFLAALWVAAGVILARRCAWRVAIAAIALPLAGLLAVLVLCGGLPVLWGDAMAPTVPRWSAWASVLFLVTSRGLWACALALLATSVLPGSGRAAPPGTRRSGS